MYHRENKEDYYRLLGELSSGIFHEIRSPLQCMDNNLIFLQEHIGSLLQGPIDPEQNAFLAEELPLVIDQTRSEIEHIHQLISALRKLSFQGEAEAQWISPGQAWKEALIISSREWKENCRIEEGPDLGLYRIMGHHPLLIQVFINLIVNAVHAISRSGRKGIISLQIQENGEELQLHLQDNGTGMDPSVLKQVFQPFFTTKGMGEGSGQGLPFVRRVVEEYHQGRIDCQSTLGKGSRFILYFPRFQKEAT